MNDLDRQRKNFRRVALAPLGRESRVMRIFDIEVTNDNKDLVILSLPQDATYQSSLQDANGNPVLAYGVTGYGVAPYGAGAGVERP